MVVKLNFVDDLGWCIGLFLFSRRVLYVGCLFGEKGVDDFVEVWVGVLFVGLDLVIVGDGFLCFSLERMVMVYMICFIGFFL